jgi:hypothetical protein
MSGLDSSLLSQNININPVIKDGVLSPAEIQSICFKHNCIKACIDELVGIFNI